MPQQPPHLLHFDSIGMPEEGYISTTQDSSKIPFQINRVFWTYNTPAGVVRGKHAHRETEQVLVATQGRIEIEVDAGKGATSTFVLDSPDKGLYLPPMHWTYIHMGDGAVLLSLASTDFLEEDYIREYNVFKQEVHEQ